jgi:hypothetical protein
VFFGPVYGDGPGIFQQDAQWEKVEFFFDQVPDLQFTQTKNGHRINEIPVGGMRSSNHHGLFDFRRNGAHDFPAAEFENQDEKTSNHAAVFRLYNKP